MKLNKQKIRCIFWGLICLLGYGASITFLFSNHEILLSLGSVFILFIGFHFLYLDTYKFHRKYLALTLVLGIIFTTIISSPLTPTIFIGNIAFHATIGLLAFNLYQQTEGSTGFNGLSYFSAGGYRFTMALSLVYSALIVSFFTKFPMNCQELNGKTNGLITSIASPFKMSREKTQERTNSSSKIFSSTFNDIFQASNNIEISSPNKENKLVKTIKGRKENLITKTLEENQKLNNTICDYTLNTINEKLQSPTIQYPVVILIILLIYPFLRIVVWIISLLGYTLFALTYLCRLYTKNKEMKEVERIG